MQRATCELVDATVFNCAVSCDCGFERLSVRLTTKPVNQCRLTDWPGATMSSQTAAKSCTRPQVAFGVPQRRRLAATLCGPAPQPARPKRAWCGFSADGDVCSAIARFVHTSSGVQRSAEHATDAAQRTAALAEDSSAPTDSDHSQ
jgi:hypothetical protein